MSSEVQSSGSREYVVVIRGQQVKSNSVDIQTSIPGEVL